MDSNLALSDPVAVEIACIIARNQENPRYLGEMLTQALIFERLLVAPPGSSSI